jgi:hypothetical protein
MIILVTIRNTNIYFARAWCHFIFVENMTSIKATFKDTLPVPHKLNYINTNNKRYNKIITNSMALM